MTELLALDCQGGVHGLSAHPTLAFDVGLSSGFLNKTFSFLRDAVLSRMQCHCPALASSGLLDHYYRLDFVSFLGALREWYADADLSRLTALCGDANGALQSIWTVLGITGLPSAFFSIFCSFRAGLLFLGILVIL